MKIQEEVRKNPKVFKVEEIRKKEITMDINQQKEPEIVWKFPRKIKLEKDIETELNEEGKESQEKKYIQDFCDSQLRVRYFKQIQEPSELEKTAKMFSFTDENIPKIENSQIATKTNDVSVSDVSLFWENICQKNITKEDLTKLKELLEKAVEIKEEQKQQILDIAQKKYEESQMNQNYLNPNNNNININNNLTINNNQRILSMNNYPNPMNFNSMNPVGPNPALSLINNIKQFPQNIDQNTLLSQNYQSLQNTLQSNAQNIGINQLNIPNLNMNYPFDQNMTSLNQLNNFQTQIQNNNINQGGNNMHQKSNLDQRMIFESAQRMNISKYKTKPCRNYHGPTGCTRGDNCFFIHDPNYKGREIVNFDPRNYERDFPLQIQNFVPQGMMPGLGTIGNQFNMGQFGMGIQPMIGLAGNMGINNNMGQGGNQEIEQGKNMGLGMNIPGYDFSYVMQGQQNGN